MSSPPWDFNGTDEGFVASNSSSITTGSTYTTYSISGGSAYPNFKNSAANINTSDGNYIALTIQNKTENTRLQVITTVGDSNSFTNFDNITTNDTDFVTYYIDMSNNANWSGTLNIINFRFKFDPNNGTANSKAGDIYINNIEILDEIPTFPLDFSNSVEGFIASNSSSITTGSSYATYTISDGSSYPNLKNSNANINTSDGDYIALTIKNNTDNEFLRIILNDNNIPASRASVNISSNDSNFVTYYVDMSDITNWTGIINIINFRFKSNAEDLTAKSKAGEIYIDNIAIMTSFPLDFSNSVEGFVASNYSSITAGTNYATYTIISPNNDGNGGSANPNFKNSSVYINTSDGNYIALTIRNNTENTRLQVITTVGDSNSFTNFDNITTNDTNFVTYYIDMSNNANWNGILNIINFRFKESSTVNNSKAGDIYIDHIAIVDEIPTFPLDFSNSVEGFVASNSSSITTGTNYAIYTIISPNNDGTGGSAYPNLKNSAANINTLDGNYIALTIQNNTDNTLLKIIMNNDFGANSVDVNISSNDSNFVTYYIDMSNNYHWNGILNIINFRFKESSTVNKSKAGDIYIDNMAIVSEIPSTTIDINSNNLHQRVEGFGGSYAFYLNLISNDDNNNTVLNNIFGQDGLNIDILRVNNHYASSTDTEIDQSNLEKTVNFIKDAQGINPELKTLLTSWGPPANYKSNDSHLGGDLGSTLKKDADGNFMYDEFAVWFKNSVDYFENTEDIKIDYLSIQNEPNFSATYHDSLLAPVEGDNFTDDTGNNLEIAGFSEAFNAVWETIAIDYYNNNRTVDEMPKFIGPETISFANSKLGDPQSYIDNFDKTKLDRIYAFSHHLYQKVDDSSFPDHLNTEMNDFKTANNYKPIFQTEFSISPSSSYSSFEEGDWDRSYNLAKLIHNSLVEEEVSAYFYWSLLWTGSDRQGLVMYSNNEWVYTPEYWSFMHYSRFIGQDSRRIDINTNTSNVIISGFISPNMDKLTLIILNNQSSSDTLDLNFVGLNVEISQKFITTKDTDNNNLDKKCESVSISNYSNVDAHSLTTLVFNITQNRYTNISGDTDKPNVLFISVDDLRPLTRTHSYPYMVTPNIDKLVNEGYQFNNAYAQVGICGPSRASVLTGTRPDTNLIYDLTSIGIRDGPFGDNQTLPQFFKENDYYTVDCGKTFDARNFDTETPINYNANDYEYSETDSETPISSKSWSLVISDNASNYSGIQNGEKPAYHIAQGVDDNAFSDGVITENAIKWLKGDSVSEDFNDTNSARSTKPVFLSVGYKKPHLPFIAPKKYWDYYPTTDNNDYTNLYTPTSDVLDENANATPYSYTNWDELRNYDNIPSKTDSDERNRTDPVSNEQKINLIRGYQACVSYIDEQIGKLITQLEDTSNDVNINNTVIILWGDQGFHLGNKGQWCKHTNFDVATRIPLIIRDPRKLGGVRINNIVEALDIYPTLRKLCNLESANISHTLEGKDLSNYLSYSNSNENLSWDNDNMSVTEYIRNNGNVIGYSIKNTRYKYTRWYNNVTNDIANSRYFVNDFLTYQYHELYDIYIDPEEKFNIVDDISNDTRLFLENKFINFINSKILDNTSPSIMSTQPSNGQTMVPLNSDILITFDKNVSFGEGYVYIKRVRDDEEIEKIDVTGSQVSIISNTMTISPNSDLEFYKSFYVDIDSTAVRDSGGNNYAGLSGKTSLFFSTICFSENTPIQQLVNGQTQETPIKNLQTGDIIMTKHGPQSLSRLSKQPCYSETEYVFFPQGCFQENLPSQDLWVTGAHPISLGYVPNEKTNGGKYNPDQDKQVFIHMQAADLVGKLPGIKKVKLSESHVYNLIFDIHTSVDVAGMEFLSHHPKPHSEELPKLNSWEYQNSERVPKKDQPYYLKYKNLIRRHKPKGCELSEFLSKCVTSDSKRKFKLKNLGKNDLIVKKKETQSRLI